MPFPFAADLYVSYTWEGVRNSAGGDGNKIMLGKRPFKAYLQRPPEELYDMENDPDEVHNLASDPEYKKIITEMRMRLEKWQLKTGDPFLLRDNVSLPVVRGYVKEGEKIDLPDRFYIPLDRPGTKDVPAVKWTDDEVGVSSGFWSCD